METNEDEKKQKTKQKINQVRNIILIILFNIVFPYLIYLMANISNIQFLRERMLKTHIFFFMYEIAIIYGWYYFFKAIFKKSLRANIALAILFNIISIISFYKVRIIEKPFWPEDIFMVGNALEIAGYGNLYVELTIVSQLILTVLLLVSQFVITKYTKYEGVLKNISRIIIGIVAIIILCVVCLFNWTKVEGFGSDNYNNKINYSKYGAIVEFFRKTYIIIEKPSLDIYSEAKVEEIKKESDEIAQKNKEEQTEQADEEKPNIIAIMAESFMDITQIDMLEFETDPLPTYRSLIKEHPHGNTIVSTFSFYKYTFFIKIYL